MVLNPSITRDALIDALQALGERQIVLDAESTSVRTRIDELREEVSTRRTTS